MGRARHHHLGGTFQMLGPVPVPALAPSKNQTGSGTMQTSLVSSQPTWGCPSSLPLSPGTCLFGPMVSSRRLGKEGQRGKMHILQVPVKGLWGRKLKLMGKLWLSFIYATVASISPEM